jgi:carboxypeptidase D
MVGFDVPHVAHDMILRFMGVDFSIINSHASSTGAIPSRVGDDIKPIGEVSDSGSPGGGDAVSSPGGDAPPKDTTPSDNSAMWQGALVCSIEVTETESPLYQAYYNAGSAALVLVVIAVVIGGGFYIRSRRRGAVKLASSRERDEEAIPLNQSVGGPGDGERADYTPIGEDHSFAKLRAKGKQKADDEPKGAAIFDVGEDEDEDTPGSHRQYQ